MDIIDGHHHLWAPQTPELDVGYVWLKEIGARRPFGDPTPIQRDYLLDELRGEQDTHPLVGSVHLQVDPRIPDHAAETAFVQKISDESGFPIMLVGYTDLAQDTCGDVLDRHMTQPNFRGIRQILSYLPDRPEKSFVDRNLIEDLAWRANFAQLKDRGLSFDLMLYPEQMLAAADFLGQHPDVPVALEHLGSPLDRSADGMARWREGMEALASLPHVTAKLSGYAMYFHSDLDSEASHITQQIIEMFGPERLIFGSNFPVDALYLTYPDALDFVLAEVPTEHHRAVFHDNARRFYRF
ncbi:MAG: amidohydrolase family protein [Sulfitobacter sp.]|nr:amidohydrolase family protein [Sulfitobacter sp.]